MAIAALALWMCTVAVGTYLLATARRYGNAEAAPSEPVSVSARQPASSAADAPAPATPARVKDPFAPPSLQRERSESLPLMRALVEFAHPALGMIGLGFWFGYVVSRDRLFLAISLGILLGAIGAGAVLVHRQQPRGQAGGGRRGSRPTRRRGPPVRPAHLLAPGAHRARGGRGPHPADRRADHRTSVDFQARPGHRCIFIRASGDCHANSSQTIPCRPIISTGD